MDQLSSGVSDVILGRRGGGGEDRIIFILYFIHGVVLNMYFLIKINHAGVHSSHARVAVQEIKILVLFMVC